MRNQFQYSNLMQIYDNTIFYFEKEISTKNLEELDTYLANSLVRTYDWHPNNRVDLSKETLDLINLNLENVESKIFEYLLEFRHETRPDLKSYHWMYYIDRDKIDWNKPPKKSKSFSVLRESNKIKIEKGAAAMMHRGNVLYEGNYSRVSSCVNKFLILIGMSRDDEHESEIYFPIQKQSIKLNRGDVLVTPAGITHPYVVNNIINGKFKFVEGI